MQITKNTKKSSKKLADNMDSISNIGTKKGYINKSPSVGRMHWKRFFRLVDGFMIDTSYLMHLLY